MTASDTSSPASDQLAASVDDRREFSPVYHVYGPHRAGLPNLVVYFRELLRRREFATEMSRAVMRSSNVNTFFGQAWLVISPMLMVGVYFVLVGILNPGRGGLHPLVYLAHLTSALFVYQFVATSLTDGSTSVVKSGRLLLNIAFPRLLMPLSAVRTAFFHFLPTVPVMLLIHIIAGLPWRPTMIIALFFLLCLTGFAMGLASLFATLQVYFRDTRSFLKFFMRLWMYLSPVLWTIDEVAARGPAVLAIAHINPLVPMIGGYTDSLQGSVPPASYFLVSAAWALFTPLVGFLLFISRERDFPVRVV